jgi:ABC-type multidrug transport system ATPase subunit
VANAVEGSGISKRFGKTPALDALSFAVPKGAFYLVAGPNGSGKTTLLGIMAGVIKPDSGELGVNGSVGYCSQLPLIYEDLSVVQNLEVFSSMLGARGSGMKRNIELLQLDSFLSRQAGELSPGVKKKLELAVSLLGGPDVLVLDEPTTGLDRESSSELLAFLKTIPGGKTVVVATHQLSDFQGLCTHLLVLRKGRKLYEGRASARLDKKYGKSVGWDRHGP